MPDDTKIKLFEVERLCRPDLDVSQLTLTSEVDRSESVYTQKYVKLANASLPGAVIVDEDGTEDVQLGSSSLLSTSSSGSRLDTVSAS